MTPEREAQMREVFQKKYGKRPTNDPLLEATWDDRKRVWDYCAASLDPVIKDAERLEWLLCREAWVTWSKDHEYCRVFLLGDDGPEPALGWGSQDRSYTEREAIDKAMSAALEEGNATE